MNHSFHLCYETTRPNNSHKHGSPSVPVNYSSVAGAHVPYKTEARCILLPVPFITPQITSTRWMCTAATCDRSGVSRIRHATRPTFIYNCNSNWGSSLNWSSTSASEQSGQLIRQPLYAGETDVRSFVSFIPSILMVRSERFAVQ